MKTILNPEHLKTIKNKKPSRRQIRNTNRKANKWHLRPFVPTLSLRESADVERLAAHVQDAVIGRFTDTGDAEDIASGYDWSPIDQPDGILPSKLVDVDYGEASLEAFINADIEENYPPDNGYDYTNDTASKVKPTGSNAWPWNRKLACCGRNEKTCQCGTWRRYA